MFGFERPQLLAPIPHGEVWLNSPPLQEKDLRGKVILVDFWTYSCVNCLRTIPYLRQWWDRYKQKDFILIGVHTPEFAFEKDQQNVREAVARLGVSWPVVLDNDYSNWKAYANRYWPAKYLVNRKGKIVFTHFGEGDYTDTEMAIQQALMDGDSDFVPSAPQEWGHEHGKVCFIPTPELYCGYGRGRFMNPAILDDQVSQYELPEEPKKDTVGLAGEVYVDKEFVRPITSSSSVAVQFSATEVNAVLHPEEGEVEAEVLLDGKPLSAHLRGNDVAENGTVIIDRPRMYNLLKAGELVSGLLALRPKKGNFRCYVFTFSGCV